jgi:hypothetical protein
MRLDHLVSQLPSGDLRPCDIEVTQPIKIEITTKPQPCEGQCGKPECDAKEIK